MKQPDLETGAVPAAAGECSRCPLHRVRAGAVVRVKQLCASPPLAQRLREIGLGEEQIIRLITSSSNIICQVCAGRLAISSGLARVIYVEPVLEVPHDADRT